MSDGVYLDYTQNELDRAYDQRAWASNAAELIESYARLSAEVRDAHPHHADIAYGPGADETLDWFPAEGDGRAIHIHLHGGAWRALGKSDVSFVAPALTARGVHVVAPDFTNLPAARMPDMVDQLIRAVMFVHRNAEQFGGDPDRLFISGHSSGAHLCAVLLTHDWSAHALPRNIFKGGLCVAGLYDLAPVMLSSRRLYVDLAAKEARRLSPIHHAATITCPVAIAYGGRESPEFIRQARAFAARLAALHRPVHISAFGDLNHFEMAMELGRPGSDIHHMAMAQIEAFPS